MQVLTLELLFGRVSFCVSVDRVCLEKQRFTKIHGITPKAELVVLGSASEFHV